MLRSTMASATALLLTSPALADHTIAAGSLSQSGPAATLDAQTVSAGVLVGGLSVNVTKPNAYSDAELIGFAAQHVHAHTTDYNATASASLAYGITGHFTVSASLPFVVRNHLREGSHSHAGGTVSNTVEQLGTVSGIGDLSLLAQYIVAHDHKKGWFVSALGGLKLPTGETHEANPSGERLETEHQPGTGSWDPLLGLAASKSWGPWSWHGSWLYQISTRGSQATEMGDRMNLSTAIVRTFASEPEHDHMDGMAGEHHHDAGPTLGVMLETSYEREERQRVSGVIEEDTGAEVIWLSPGVRYGSPAGWSAALSAGLPVWQDVGRSHPDNSFRVVGQVGTRF
jgi:hypothetical protein